MDFDVKQMLNGEELTELDAREFTTHVVDLCAEIKVAWRPSGSIPWLAARGSLEAREFESPLIRRDLDYFAALHELGHLALDLQEFEGDDLKLENEEKVWLWALDQARVHPSAHAAQMIYGAMFSKGVPMTHPAATRMKALCEGYAGPMRRKEATGSAE